MIANLRVTNLVRNKKAINLYPNLIRFVEVNRMIVGKYYVIVEEEGQILDDELLNLANILQNLLVTISNRRFDAKIPQYTDEKNLPVAIVLFSQAKINSTIQVCNYCCS